MKDDMEDGTEKLNGSNPETSRDFAKENADLKTENEALKAELSRLRNVAFSLEVTCKTLASMTQVPSLLGPVTTR